MSIHMPAAFDGETVKSALEARAGSAAWTETALAILFAASAVLFVSFVAVVTGIV